jgi:uncharacterized tellurite resistance protein B-like protein
MIFIGTMNLSRTRERGDFYCPDCESMQAYRLKAKRPWITLYFIPVGPIGKVEIVSRCDNCHSNWDESVLKVDADSHRELLEDQASHEIFRAVVLYLLSDGYMEENEIEPLREIASEVFGRDVDREELGRLCSSAEQSGIKVRNYVTSVLRYWNPEQQRLAIQSMFLAGSLRGELDSDRLELLMEIRQTAGLSDQGFRTLIEEGLQRSDQ